MSGLDSKHEVISLKLSAVIVHQKKKIFLLRVSVGLGV